MVEWALPEGVIQLDEMEILVIIDNETDTLSSVDAGVPQIPEVFHTAARMKPTRHFEGHECNEAFNQLCSACHGLSYLITGRRDGQERTLLFDAGPYPDVWLENARRLGVDLSNIETIFLSHWHYDHSGALPGVVSEIAKSRSTAGRAPPAVDLHPDRPDQRGMLVPAGPMLLIPEDPGIDDLSRAGGEIVTRDDPHTLCGGHFFASGAIERVTEYETGLVGHYTFRGDQGAPDPLIMDERFIAACVKGRGVTVFSACSHAGIVNTCLSAKAYFPNIPVDVVIGGYHLAGRAMEARIEPTVRDLLERIDPRVVAPGHCTGWHAEVRLAEAFAPGRYGPSVVGTKYRLSA